MLSPRRIGITVRANRAWQQSKERMMVEGETRKPERKAAGVSA
jgi:hypothetical protein